MKKYYIILAIFGLFGCDNTDTENSFAPINISPEIILDGQLSTGQFNLDGEQFIINTSTAYQNLVNQITPVLYSAYQNNDYTANVNFNQNLVICIISKRQTYLMNRIVVDSIIENENNTTITYHVAIINQVMPALEQIIFLFKIPKSEKPILFIEE